MIQSMNMPVSNSNAGKSTGNIYFASFMLRLLLLTIKQNNDRPNQEVSAASIAEKYKTCRWMCVCTCIDISVKVISSFYFIHFFIRNYWRILTKYNLLHSQQYRRICFAFSTVPFNKHSACIPDEHRGRAASISGNIRAILSTNFINSVHIERWA